MTLLRYLQQSLRGHAFSLWAVFAAVAIATGVLTGAFLVGDSVRGSLRQLVLQRMGLVTHVLLSEQFLADATVDALAAHPNLANVTVVPVTLLPQVTVEKRESGVSTERTRDVFLLASGAVFWQLALDRERVVPTLQPQEAVVNRALADELDVNVGDQVTVRLPTAEPVNGDSALGKKEGRVTSLIGLTVKAILPNDGIASFGLSPTQAATRNVFVHPDALRDAWDRDAVTNAVLMDASASPDIDIQWETAFSPSLEDCGIKLARRRMPDPQSAEFVWDYVDLTHERLVWGAASRRATQTALASMPYQEVFTYMANALEKRGSVPANTAAPLPADSHQPAVEAARPSPNAVPYSTVSALKNHPTLGPLTRENGERLPALAPGEIAINRWTAEQLDAQLGASLRLWYFEPETTHGEAQEKFADFTLAAIVPLTQPARPARRRRPAEYDETPSLANDVHLTPEVDGVTDQETIDDWDPPFPFDGDRIQDRDDAYWEDYRTTPKAFLSLEDGQRLWGSRFGKITSVRIPATSDATETLVRTRLEAEIKNNLQELGFRMRALRAELETAAQGTTPFEGLFFGFSLFLIAAALALIGILFRIGVDLRRREFGALLAFGWRPRRLTRVVLLEVLLVSLVGTLFGLVVAIVYSRAMVWGLTTIWVDALTTPFLRWHATPTSLGLGAALSIALAAGVVWLSLRWLATATPLSLLKGSDAPPWLLRQHSASRRPRGQTFLALCLVAATLGILVSGTRMVGEAQAGAFFGGGALLLILLLWQRRHWGHWLLQRSRGSRLTLWGLAADTVERQGIRSGLTMGLIAAATFLLLAIAAFQLAPSERGTGGFQLMGESDRPIFDNLADSEVRAEVFGRNAEAWRDATVLPLRVTAGDDASCRNLYQVARPRLVGISSAWYRHFAEQPNLFSLQVAAADQSDPWAALKRTSDPLPVILDKNTAMYALHLPATLGHTFSYDYDGTVVPFQIVGLLSNSVFQGRLLVDERRLAERFPHVSGYHQVFVKGVDGPHEIQRLFEDRYADEGLDVRSCDDVLRELLAVQNTYLSTFQSLGGLGLLLGTIGLAAVQFRSILSRVRELALYHAVGFSPEQIQRQLMRENVWLLFQGVGVGTVAALTVVVPHMFFGEAALPWGTMITLIGLVAGVGLLASRVAAAIVRQWDTLASLRRDH